MNATGSMEERSFNGMFSQNKEEKDDPINMESYE